jgi:hypothetical protein
MRTVRSGRAIGRWRALNRSHAPVRGPSVQHDDPPFWASAITPERFDPRV